MKGASSAQSRPYWIRYVVAFWAVEKLTWAKDNVLIACVCSLAPGLIAVRISTAISDHMWRKATYATLLKSGRLFALFLMWRVVAYVAVRHLWWLMGALMPAAIRPGAREHTQAISTLSFAHVSFSTAQNATT